MPTGDDRGVRGRVAATEDAHAANGRPREQLADGHRADERLDAVEVDDPAAAALEVGASRCRRRVVQGRVAVRRTTGRERPPRGERRQPLGEQPHDERCRQVGDLDRQRDVRTLPAGGPVRRRRARCRRRQAPDETEQVVVGPALVDVHGVETDHDGAHADGSAHIGFV